MNCREVGGLLDARLDNELDMASAASVDLHLSECRACAAQYAALLNLHEEIVASDLSYTPRAELERRISASLLGRGGSWFGSWAGSWLAPGGLAAAAVGMAVVGMAVIIMWGPGGSDSLRSEILDSHLRSLQPVHPVDVPSSDQHTVKPWFQGKIDFSPPVPDLSAEGFVLTGGRLEVIHQQPAAAIVYQRRQHVISMYVSPSAGADSGPQARELGGYHLLEWRKNNLSFWAVSDVDARDLRTFADLIRGR
jgi:anti-sigma factor RsiW